MGVLVAAPAPPLREGPRLAFISLTGTGAGTGTRGVSAKRHHRAGREALQACVRRHAGMVGSVAHEWRMVAGCRPALGRRPAALRI